MRNFSNPTENSAIGTVDREIRRMEDLAESLRRKRERGSLTPADIALAHRSFRGIHRKFLAVALGE